MPPIAGNNGPSLSYIGPITATHCAEWSVAGVLEDSGSTCGGGGAANLTVGTSTITSGTNGRVLYDNSGVLGELPVSGSGNAVLATSPTVAGLTVTGSLTATGLVTNADLANSSVTIGSTAVSLGGTAASISGLTLASPTVTGAFTATGLVTNADLANSSLTIAGHSVSLGGTQTLACADLSNGATGCSTATGTSGATIPLLNTANTWSATQSSTPQTLAISTSTFTPVVASGNNIKITLVHASCPCTFANWSGTPVAGTSGVLEVIQSSTGSDTIGTWGSQYVAAAGVTTLALSTAANAIDFFSYYVIDSTHTLITTAALNATH